MMDDEEENWRAREFSLGFAVLEAVNGTERGRKASLCMDNGKCTARGWPS